MPSRDQVPREQSGQSERRAPSESGAEWCTIVLARTDDGAAEFRVITLANDGRRRVTGQSAPFRVWRSMRVRRHGRPRAAHEALVAELLAAGWRPVESRGRWHDVGFIRHPYEL